MRTPAVWVLGVVVAAVASSLTAVIVGIMGNFVDPAKTSDKFARGEPISLAQVGYPSGVNGWATVAPLDHRTMTSLRAVPESNDFDDWMANHGAIHRLHETLTLTLEGNRADPVQITEMRPHLIRCRAPASGSLLYMEPAGSLFNPVMTVDLDAASPVFRDGASAEPTHARPYFASHSISLARNEVVTINITATVHQRRCEWDIIAAEVVDGHSHTQEIGASNHWTVTGSAQLGQYKSLYAMAGEFDIKGANSDFAPVTTAWFCTLHQPCGNTDLP